MYCCGFYNLLPSLNILIKLNIVFIYKPIFFRSFGALCANVNGAITSKKRLNDHYFLFCFVFCIQFVMRKAYVCMCDFFYCFVVPFSKKNEMRGMKWVKGTKKKKHKTIMLFWIWIRVDFSFVLNFHIFLSDIIEVS